MASIRKRERADGSEYFAVLYRLDGKQSSTSFEDYASASKFADVANKFGVTNALESIAALVAPAAVSTEDWLTHYVDHLTGVDSATTRRYRSYIRNDIAPVLGPLPVGALAREHIAQWINGMMEPDEDGWSPSAKTIANKHGFLAGALGAAVPKHLAVNPCEGTRLRRGPRVRSITFLSHDDFAMLHSKVTAYWQPMVEFLVASGARWGEVAALRPSDVNRAEGTVRIDRAWRSGGQGGGYRLDVPKTPKSLRTIDVPAETLDKLDYSEEWLFINREGGPVRSHGFIRRVWTPAVERAWPTITDDTGKPVADPSRLNPTVQDLRHTCASWMIQGLVALPVVQEHLGHESIETTVAVYGHLDRRSKKSAAEAIGRALIRP